MPHMKYAGQTFLLGSNVDFDEFKDAIDETLQEDKAACMQITGKDGMRNAFFISRGVPVTLHSWDPVDADGLIEGLRNMGIDHKADQAPASDD